MIEWLKSGVKQRPERVVSARSAEDASETARVVPDFDTGTIFLRGPAGDVGLDWKQGEKKQGEKGDDRSRALPPGGYELRTVRVERTKGDDHWFVSISGDHGRSYRLRRGKTTEIAIPAKVTFKARATRRGRELSLGFGITDGDHRGLSIYRNDRRVDVTYEVLGRGDKVLKSGRMNYG